MLPNNFVKQRQNFANLSENIVVKYFFYLKLRKFFSSNVSYFQNRQELWLYVVLTPSSNKIRTNFYGKIEM